MNTFRICWKDLDGDGRFVDVDADTRDKAIWDVANGLGVENKPAMFVSCSQLTDRR